jgi:hypothetical protein
MLPAAELLLQYWRRVELLPAIEQMLHGRGPLLLSPPEFLLQRQMLRSVPAVLRHGSQRQVLSARPNVLQWQVLQTASVRKHYLQQRY